MSDILNLRMKSKKMSVTLNNPLENKNIKTERDENYLERELNRRYEKGYKDAQAELTDRLESEYSIKLAEKYEELNQVKGLLDKILPEYQEAFEKAVINLSVAISEKIVKREILRDSIITEVLSDALKKVVGANRVIVKLNPDDFDLVEAAKDSDFSIESFDKIKFEKDNRIEHGGCNIETEIGNVDARIASQFAEIKKQLEHNV